MPTLTTRRNATVCATHLKGATTPAAPTPHSGTQARRWPRAPLPYGRGDRAGAPARVGSSESVQGPVECLQHQTALEVIQEAAAEACAFGAAKGTTIGGTADVGTAEACAACVAAAAAGPPPKPLPSPPHSCHLRKGAPSPASPPSSQVTPAGCRCRRACATMRGRRHPALILAVKPEKKRALRQAG